MPTKSSEINTQLPLRDRAGLNTFEAAKYTGLGYSTLKKMRAQGTGPKYAKIGSSVIYRPTDLDDFLDQQIVSA